MEMLTKRASESPKASGKRSKKATPTNKPALKATKSFRRFFKRKAARPPAKVAIIESTRKETASSSNQKTSFFPDALFCFITQFFQAFLQCCKEVPFSSCGENLFARSKKPSVQFMLPSSSGFVELLCLQGSLKLRH